MDGSIARIVGISGVPRFQQQLALVMAQQRQMADPLLRILGDGLQQVEVMAPPALDGVRQVQVGVELESAEQGAARFEQVQHQVELAFLLGDLERQYLESAPVAGCGCLAGQGRGEQVFQLPLLGQLQEVKSGLEHRRAAGIAGLAQALHQLREGQFPVGEGFQRVARELLQEIGEGRVAGQIAAQHHRVDEIAHQRVVFRSRPAAVGAAHQDVVLAAVAVQQHLVGGQHQGEQGDALAGGQGFQPFGEDWVHRHGQGLPPVAAGGGTGKIGGNVQHRQLAAQAVLPVAPQPFAVGVQVLFLLLDEVVVAVSQQRQPRRLAAGVLPVQRAQLPQHDKDGLAVDGDVVHHRQQHVVVVGERGQGETGHRSHSQVDRPAIGGVQPELPFGFA
ncbi:hypothetical protein MoryE10_15660 [Methylogaea oryzae]|uniref:Uncharacterized protein n=1 Tax=Methylogaea oryzae TaxID=1295382 RepID=A0A8D4VRA6_9GAMM|nr:hypothetical protein MoryE10_15660 [Methylogaea oryzae]